MGLIYEILQELNSGSFSYKGFKVGLLGLPKFKIYSQNTLSGSLDYMCKKGLLEYGNDKINITHKGKEYVKRKYDSLKQFNCKFDKNAPRNLIVMFDIPETRKAEREWLRWHLKKFNYLIGKKIKEISGKDAFLLFQSYGFPLEMTVELAEEKKISVNSKEFEKEFEKHQKLSRTASAGTFKSGLADNSDKTRRLHTATHLLNEALKVVLNDKSIKQKGSNITPERLRFDFNMPRKLTDEEIKRIESWVNDKISRHLAMKREEMPLKKAFESGAEGEFGAKYPEIVSVYTLEDKKDKLNSFLNRFGYLYSTSILKLFWKIITNFNTILFILFISLNII